METSLIFDLLIKNHEITLIGVIGFFMLILCYSEWKSIRKKSFKDFKPIIISLGILGTFIGIFIGLWNFNTDNITASVPSLLDGLKMAFITSILGMGLSILMSIVEMFTRKESLDNTSDDSQKLKFLGDILKEINQNTKLIYDSTIRSEKSVNQKFNELNSSLKKALDTLSKGATEEIINALEKVISDFNKNLTEQFGDNFKQLNESVKIMIQWQENYKVAIKQIEKNLQVAVINIEKTSDYTQKFTNNYKKISEASEDLHQIIKVNQNQIKNIETHMKNLKKIGDEANIITTSIDDFSKTIQKSLNGQSEGLRRLNNDFVKQIDSSLGNLDTILSSLTHKFREDYGHFLSSIKKINEYLTLNK